MDEVIFDHEAVNFLEKIPKEMRRRIFDKITSTKDSPHHYFVKLVGRNDFKMRVGDYRVIADVKDDEKKIEVTRIGHRKNIYHE